MKNLVIISAQYDLNIEHNLGDKFLGFLRLFQKQNQYTKLPGLLHTVKTQKIKLKYHLLFYQYKTRRHKSKKNAGKSYRENYKGSLNVAADVNKRREKQGDYHFYRVNTDAFSISKGGYMCVCTCVWAHLILRVNPET